MPILRKSCIPNKPRTALALFALAVLPVLVAGLLLGSRSYNPATLWLAFGQDPRIRCIGSWYISGFPGFSAHSWQAALWPWPVRCCKVC